MGDLASAIGIRADETDFVAQLKSGSEDAFALLIAQYGHSVYSLVARSLRDPADAADVTQDVFIKVFRNISSFHGEACLRTWIYRIALHEASNQRRWWSRHKRQELTIDAPREDEEGETYFLADILAAGDASPFDHAARAERSRRIEAALQSVPEAFRQVVVLRDIEGFAYEEIADLLRITIGTVKSRLARGRSALREALAATSSAAERLPATQRNSRPVAREARAPKASVPQPQILTSFIPEEEQHSEFASLAPHIEKEAA